MTNNPTPAANVGVGTATYSPTADGGSIGNSYVTDISRGERIASLSVDEPLCTGRGSANTARSFYRDIANGVATIEAACAWIRSEFDEQCRPEMMQMLEQRRKSYD